MTLRLHDYLPSGNGYKVRLLLTQLGIPFERIEYDIDRGETRTPAFLENVNANGTSQVRVINNDVAGGAVGSSVSAPPIAVENGSSATAAFNPTMCVTISGNTTAANVAASPNVFPGILLAKRTGQFGITGGLTPSPAPNATTEAFLTGLNPNSNLGAGFYNGKRVVVNVGDNLVSCAHPAGF
jgi:hypothetical protein